MALRREAGARLKAKALGSIRCWARDALALRPAGQMKLPTAVAGIMPQRDGRLCRRR